MNHGLTKETVEKIVNVFAQFPQIEKPCFMAQEQKGISKQDQTLI